MILTNYPLCPGGRIPEALMTNVVSIKQKVEGQPTQGEGQHARMDTTKFKSLEAKAAQMFRDGVYTQINQEHMVPQTPSPIPNRLDGKTIVNNKPFGGITVSSIFDKNGALLMTAEMANSSAKLGAPTHGFFYQDTDFLLSAAKEYAVLEEGQVFRHRSIDDVNFVRDALDFLTNGSASEVDVAVVQYQMEGIVQELAQQIKKGEQLDLSKVESTLTIGGADVSISQLLDLQNVGKKLAAAFSGVSVGQLHTQEYAQMGLAKAIGNYYGSDKGEAGELFSSAINRLYDKGIAKIKQTYNTASYLSKPWNARQEDAVKVGLDIADTFASLDTSSKGNLSKDFNATSALIQQMVQNHCNQFGLQPSYLGLTGDMLGLTKYFNTWMDQV